MRSPPPLTIRVEDTAGLKGKRPVTGGVPLPQGAAPRGTSFVLKNAKGASVPLQSKLLARWPDGSAKWVLLDFAADPPARGKTEFRLTWRGSAKPARHANPLRVRRGASPGISSERVRIERSGNGLFRMNHAFDVSLTMTDSRGRAYSGVASRARIETAGKLRSALLLEGDLKHKSGRRAFSFRMRVTAFAGMSCIRVEPMIVVDSDEGAMQPVRELRLDVRSVTGQAPWGAIGGRPGWRGPLKEKHCVRLLQVDDQQYRLEGARGRGRHAPGWAELSTEQARLALCMRDLRQQWPKSIELAANRASIGLFPRFKRGAFDHMQPWHKYGYLFKGAHYQLKTGQARRWEIWMDLSRSGARLCKLVNAPIIPVADPEQATATGVWGGVLPAGRLGSEAYDNWADGFCRAFIKSVETGREYGAMNWGDWWGERYVNWGNNEYDTGNLLLVAFARTGNPRYFRAAEAAVRHMSEVDIIHAVNPDLVNSFTRRPGQPVRPGCVHEHCVGHVGGFCSPERIRRLMVKAGVGRGRKHLHLCLDPRNLGHVWTEGMTRLYFLTGDAWARESAELVADNLAGLVETHGYHFVGHAHSGRTVGWPLLALAAVYEIAHSSRCRRAMKCLVDDTLSDQDPNCGGWIYRLPYGHCLCEKEKHVGMCSFLTAIMINGLTRYYDVTGDRRIPDAVHRAAVHMNNDAWLDERSCWRVSSCPASPPTEDSGLVILALANAIRLSSSLGLKSEGKPDKEHLRILRKAFPSKLGVIPKPGRRQPAFGKEFSMAILGTAEAAAALTTSSGT